VYVHIRLCKYLIDLLTSRNDNLSSKGGGQTEERRQVRGKEDRRESQGI
jgi:hypothetical protein